MNNSSDCRYSEKTKFQLEFVAVCARLQQKNRASLDTSSGTVTKNGWSQVDNGHR